MLAAVWAALSSVVLSALVLSAMLSALAALLAALAAFLAASVLAALLAALSSVLAALVAALRPLGSGVVQLAWLLVEKLSHDGTMQCASFVSTHCCFWPASSALCASFGISCAYLRDSLALCSSPSSLFSVVE